MMLDLVLTVSCTFVLIYRESHSIETEKISVIIFVIWLSLYMIMYTMQKVDTIPAHSQPNLLSLENLGMVNTAFQCLIPIWGVHTTTEHIGVSLRILFLKVAILANILDNNTRFYDVEAGFNPDDFVPPEFCG